MVRGWGAAAAAVGRRQVREASPTEDVDGGASGARKEAAGTSGLGMVSTWELIEEVSGGNEMGRGDWERRAGGWDRTPRKAAELEGGSPGSRRKVSGRRGGRRGNDRSRVSGVLPVPGAQGGPGGAVSTCLLTGKQTDRASRTQSVPSPSGGGRCWGRREKGERHLHA